MISRWVIALVHRLTGRKYSRSRPSSRELMEEMNSLGRKVEVKTFELRRQREDIVRTFGGRPK
jgi:hypothetical protein